MRHWHSSPCRLPPISLWHYFQSLCTLFPCVAPLHVSGNGRRVMQTNPNGQQPANQARTPFAQTPIRPTTQPHPPQKGCPQELFFLLPTRLNFHARTDHLEPPIRLKNIFKLSGDNTHAKQQTNPYIVYIEHK